MAGIRRHCLCFTEREESSMAQGEEAVCYQATECRFPKSLVWRERRWLILRCRRDDLWRDNQTHGQTHVRQTREEVDRPDIARSHWRLGKADRRTVSLRAIFETPTHRFAVYRKFNLVNTQSLSCKVLLSWKSLSSLWSASSRNTLLQILNSSQPPMLVTF